MPQRDAQLAPFSPRCVCLCLCHDGFPGDLTMKDGCNSNNILEEYRWGCLVVQVMSCTLVTCSMTSPGQKNRSNLKITIARSVFLYILSQFVAQWTSSYNTQVSVSFSVWKIASGRKSKPFSGIFKIHVLYMIALIGLWIWKLHYKLCKMKPIWPRRRH